MRKFWLVFRYEYLQHVLRKRFIFALLSMPLFVILMVGVGFLAVWAEYDGRPIGYTDLSGVFKDAQVVPPNGDSLFPPIKILRFETEQEARQELDSGKLQTMFVIDSGYLKNGKVKLVAMDATKENTRDEFDSFLHYNLLRGQSDAVRTRLLSGPDITIQSLSSSRRMDKNEFLNILLPLVSGILFVVVINTSGTYLVQALVEEKENRTMEIVVTSVSPGQLMAGKVVGDLLVGLTELVVWLFFGFLAFFFAQRYFPGAENLRINMDSLWLMVLTLLPAFVMVAALMALAGVTTTDSREAQQMAGLFTLPIMIPFFLLTQLMQSPNSPLSIGLSLFPLTAPISMPMRVAFTEVPIWQIGVCLALLVLCAAGALWLAGRAFRLGMLRYGKKLPWRAIFAKGG
jgi:ABC-2 type transport system permease protein